MVRAKYDVASIAGFQLRLATIAIIAVKSGNNTDGNYIYENYKRRNFVAIFKDSLILGMVHY